MIKKNPCENVVLPKVDRKEKIFALSQDEQQKLVKYCYENKEYIYIFMLGTGVRVGEATSLTWDCVDFANEIIKISKTTTRTADGIIIKNQPKTLSSFRDITMTESVKEILSILHNVNSYKKIDIFIRK